VFRAWLSRKQDDHEEGEEMIAAKNKYNIMVEKETWNAPTAEEKIVALEAKLESTVKNINKKVSFELGKKAATKKGGASDKGKRKETKSKGGHPKTWPPPKGDDKRGGKYRDHTCIRRCEMFSFNSHGETYPQMTTDQELVHKYGDPCKHLFSLKHCMFDTAIPQTCIAPFERI
jgi:hypothetical protein